MKHRRVSSTRGETRGVVRVQIHSKWTLARVARVVLVEADMGTIGRFAGRVDSLWTWFE